ncbi:hypothetical protein EX30DRAFT_363050 [Ascodesmis nigricans]|uniref:Uncharacterized protein n=1 Tax=Ascodesmis nigricans TaxID=341454 RepID=A0A4S2N0A4_9PEZI|nr:hypothetical protein EX30DRAFT_363050 [Ascodesmis nigricans]
MAKPITQYIRSSPFKTLWYTWRSYRFPWRKRYFIGMDLNQNTFWEFRDRINASRPRRTVVFRDKSRDWVDYASDVSPQWHQWLRALRTAAPTIAEQENDLIRLQQLKAAAKLADARWNSKPSLLNVAPHPPVDSVLEKNTRWSSDSGLRREQEVGRVVVGDVGNGKGSAREVWKPAGEGSRRVDGRGSGVTREERESRVIGR